MLLASEGIFDTKIYDFYFHQKGITIDYPNSFLKEIRYFIECVKQNSISQESMNRFYELLMEYKGKTIILGCTELAVLWERLSDEQKEAFAESIYDPLQCVIEKLQQELK